MNLFIAGTTADPAGKTPVAAGTSAASPSGPSAMGDRTGPAGNTSCEKAASIDDSNVVPIGVSAALAREVNPDTVAKLRADRDELRTKLSIATARLARFDKAAAQEQIRDIQPESPRSAQPSREDGARSDREEIQGTTPSRGETGSQRAEAARAVSGESASDCEQSTKDGATTRATSREISLIGYDSARWAFGVNGGLKFVGGTWTFADSLHARRTFHPQDINDAVPCGPSPDSCDGADDAPHLCSFHAIAHGAMDVDEIEAPTPPTITECSRTVGCYLGAHADDVPCDTEIPF